MNKYIKLGLFVVILTSIFTNIVFGTLAFNSWQYSQNINEVYLLNTISLKEFENSLKNKFTIQENHICKENLVPIGNYIQIPKIDINKIKVIENRLVVENYELVYQEKSIENYLSFLSFTQGRKDFGYDDSAEYFIPRFLKFNWQKLDTGRGCLMPVLK